MEGGGDQAAALCCSDSFIHPTSKQRKLPKSFRKEACLFVVEIGDCKNVYYLSLGAQSFSFKRNIILFINQNCFYRKRGNDII